MKCVILQPSYIPWRGYFHQIAKSDVFVFYDDVQYDKRGWRNRNRIKTSQGIQWLTIPVHSKGAQTQSININQIQIACDTQWNLDHLKALQYAYHGAPYYDWVMSHIESYYHNFPTLLADFTVELTMAISKMLGISHVQFLRSSQLSCQGTKSERLVSVLTQIGANHYITGPSAQDYLDTRIFAAHQIFVEYMQYDYPEYPQRYPPFEPKVSILDLLFMTGDKALKYIIP